MYEIYCKLRDEKGVTDATVARETGIGKSTFSDWKSGRSSPKGKKLFKIAEYFGVSVDVFGVDDAVEFDVKKIIRAYHKSKEDVAKKSSSGREYYFNDETAEIAQQVYENEGQRILFEASRGSRPEDLKMAADLLMRLKEINKDG